MRKKVDSRIRTLVENCVQLRQRGLFVIIGDKGRDQVVNLHYMLSKAQIKARPSVLWCYKKDLYLSRWGAWEGGRLGGKAEGGAAGGVFWADGSGQKSFLAWGKRVEAAVGGAQQVGCLAGGGGGGYMYKGLGRQCVQGWQFGGALLLGSRGQVGRPEGGALV